MPCPKRLRGAAAVVAVVAMWPAVPCVWAEDASTSKPAQTTAFVPSRAALDEVYEWLQHNPPDGTNRDARRRRMAVIQAACDRLAPADWDRYSNAWTEPNADQIDDAMEREHPALYYLGNATARALADIRATRVRKGLALWYLYNMGYVFKTPDACFAIDVHSRHAERLVDDLDFVLATHEHPDHWSGLLLDAMIEAKKPVVTRWYAGSTIVDEPAEFRFGTVRVKIDIGDHNHPSSVNDMLMFQVDCGPSANDAVIYHTGDDSNVLKMQPDRTPDVLIFHVQCNGMNVNDAFRRVGPRMMLPSHLLELGHCPTLPRISRWPFEFAFAVIEPTPPDRAAILTWGERWLLPGTVLETPATQDASTSPRESR